MKKFGFFVLTIVLVSFFFVIKEVRGLDGGVGSTIGGGGLLMPGNVIRINGSHNHLHGLRVYVVRDTGGNPELLSYVKDLNHITAVDTSAYETVQRFSTNSQGKGLGYRWDTTIGEHGNTEYQQWSIEGRRHYDVYYTNPGLFEHIGASGDITSNPLNSFFRGLAEKTPEDVPECEPFNNCLLKFLADDLGGFSDAMYDNLLEQQNLEDVYVMVEPAMRYIWYCDSYDGNYCSSTNTGYQHTYVLTTTEGFAYSNFHIQQTISRGGHVNQSYFQHAFSTVYNRAVHFVMNTNPPRGATDFREFSALDTVRASRNPAWEHTQCAGYTRRQYSWHLYSPHHTGARPFNSAGGNYMQAAINDPSVSAINCNHCSGSNHRPNYCDPGSPVDVSRATEAPRYVNISNTYQAGDLVGRSGFGIGYFWLNDLVEEMDREGVCEEAIDEIRSPFLGSEGLTSAWRYFIDNYLGHDNSPASIKDCCDRDRPSTEEEDLVFLEYVEEMESLASTVNLPALQTHAQRVREIYNAECFVPDDEEDECEYYIEVECPDCEEELDFGSIKDIDDWDCIFISDEVAPAEFRDHYIQESPQNDYCKVFCREDIDYVYPEPTFVVPAGFHFIIGHNEDVSPTIPSWGDLSFQSSAECRPTTDRDLEDDPLDGDHDYLQIDHVKFLEDYIEANNQVGEDWDQYQSSYLREEARDEAYYIGSHSSCGYVYVGSNSGTTGCIEEERRYSCSAYGSSWEPVTGADERNHDNFSCERRRGTGNYYSCPSGYSANFDTSRCRTSSGTCTSTQPDEDGNYDTISATRGSRCCGHLSSNYQLSGSSCVWTRDSARFSHWECNSTDTTRLQRIRTPNYEYTDPNFSENIIPSGTHEIWCSRQAHVDYSWQSDTGTHGSETRYVEPYPAEYRDNPGLISAGRPSEIPSLTQRRNTYLSSVDYRDSLVEQILECNNFSYEFDNFEPNINLSYHDYKYGGEFPLQRDSEFADEIAYHQEGSEGPYAEDVTDRYDCSSPEYPSGINCEINDQVYPINDDFRYDADLNVRFSLDGDVYRYVEKSNEQRGIFSVDSVSQHDIPSGDHYIDMGYANLPVHYYQGEYPGFGGVVHRHIELNFATPPTLGSGNRFNQFVFGAYPPDVPADCFSYECEYAINYEFPTPTEDLNMLAKFRPIDLEQPFPGFDGGGRQPGMNWGDQTNIQNVILNNRRTSSYEIYDLDPMYVIELTPRTIGQVRSYNRSHGYNESTMDCRHNNHLECVSSFIDQFDFIKRDDCLSFDWDGCH